MSIMSFEASTSVALAPSPLRKARRVMDAERPFVIFVLATLVLTGLTYQTPALAMWLGFMLAGYSAVANDSIQTLGTFLASNRHRPWWVLWMFLGGIFLATMLWGWITYDGDVSYARLATKGLAQAPTTFSFWQIAAPLVLLVLTRLRMPVSTTFLLLSCFSASKSGLTAIITKSVSGYLIAFVAAIALWFAASRLFTRRAHKKAHPAWSIVQWVSTAFLWTVWLMQDAANVAVYLPRKLSTVEFAAFAGLMLAALAYLISLRGGRIQAVVEEKSRVVDVRSATAIDFVYGAVLFFFTLVSTIPMSTTWVFIGLLAGREMAMAIDSHLRGTPKLNHAMMLIGKDLARVGMGLGISYAMASVINPALG